MLVSIVIPCHNEEENVTEIYMQIKNLFENHKYAFEIIFVDDGSSDDTVRRIKTLSNVDANVKYISFTRNFGHQAALRAGMELAIGNCIITMDGDLQHPPSLIIPMIALWDEGYPVVSALRKNTNGSRFKRLSSSIFYKFFNIISNAKLQIGNSDFRLLDRKLVKILISLPERNLFIRGLVSWCGYKQAFINYKPENRKNGMPSFTPIRMISLAISGITSFSTHPLRLSTFIGIFFAATAACYGIYSIFIYYFTSQVVPGWTSIIASILFISAIQFIILGIIGEYIGKLFTETKNRPPYLIHESNITACKPNSKIDIPLQHECNR